MSKFGGEMMEIRFRSRFFGQSRLPLRMWLTELWFAAAASAFAVAFAVAFAAAAASFTFAAAAAAAAAAIAAAAAAAAFATAAAADFRCFLLMRRAARRRAFLEGGGVEAAAAVRVYSSFIKRGTKGFWGEECLMEWCFAGGTRPPSISRGGASCLKMLQ